MATTDSTSGRGGQAMVRGTAAWALLALAGTALASGCLDRPIEPVEPRTTSTVIEKLTQDQVHRIDMLLVIDNSGSMADKQEILARAVPDLVGALINPPCLDDSGQRQNMPGPLEPCPAGFAREFPPMLDMHVGIISSSIGAHGADQCDVLQHPSMDDQAHLLTRSGVGLDDPPVSGLGSKSFLVWDPRTDDPNHDPDGQDDLGTLQDKLTAMVSGVGEVGCGYEAPLEAWYRFLVDPKPYDHIDIIDGKAQLQGTDKIIVAQRAELLRPDSLLAIIMLTDENDCSIRDGSNYFLVAQSNAGKFRMPKARAICATDPNDACCRSCAQTAGPGCDTSADQCVPEKLDLLDDSINLRCFDQKRRFGIDFLWPIDRYLTGLTAPQIADRDGELHENPLFTDLNPNDAFSSIRDSSLVFVAGIVGVPWQDIARRDAAGHPDLLQGLDAHGEPVGGLQSAAEMMSNNTWDLILGDPDSYQAPADPLMVESVEPRGGTNPVTSDPLAPPGSGWQNPINGSEYSNPERKDLQYACIFPLEPLTTPRDCAANAGSCDCDNSNNDKPLCAANPADGGQPTLQIGAKAYPGVRELQLLEGAGEQGIVGSICPSQLDQAGARDFGYRPAMGAIIERLKSVFQGGCLPRTLRPNHEGQVACMVIEANRDEACTCSGAARRPIADNHPAVREAKEDPLYQTGQWSCFCEIEQTSGAALVACQNDVSDHPVDSEGHAVDGWCYVDGTTVPPTGNPELVADCPVTQERMVRFVGEGQGSPGATLFITCAG